MTSEETKKILLICTAGITTGLLVRNVQAEVDAKGLEIGRAHV